MEDISYKIIDIGIFLITLFWIIFNIYYAMGTKSFDILNTYATTIVMIADLLWNHLIKKLYRKD